MLKVIKRDDFIYRFMTIYLDNKNKYFPRRKKLYQRAFWVAKWFC